MSAEANGPSPALKARHDGSNASSKQHICVAVRFRPLSDKERARGDHEVWNCQGNSVGTVEADMGMAVKFVYDHVFDGATPNPVVYSTVASAVVQSAVDGVNGTIFAYGVTSSGKTHTMMGDDATPGIVPHAITEVYALVGRLAKKEFQLRLSMLEIYNEVVNDLLDPGNTNLRLREDPRRGGVQVEGAREERLASADHALAVVAAGNEHRKVCATVYNEGSSRSHTIIRLAIEASDRPEYAADPGAPVTRTLSYLTMVDLAGSESARVEVNRSQRVEGSFINKSLLTLGTVIHKLSEGGAAHIPFRDSKLTRILSNSLTGNAARVAVICTITPAAAQAEETHNTLKFASRAKKITLEAKRNEIMDQASLIARYQQEITLLRRQLDLVMMEGGGGALAPNDPMHPQIRTLREQYEEEHLAAVEKEKERARLAERVDRLTRCVLDSTAALSHLQRRLQQPRAEAARVTWATAAIAGGGGEPWQGGGPDAAVEAAVMAVRGAGELIPGSAAVGACAARNAEQTQQVEVAVLRRQVIALVEELREQGRAMRALAAAGSSEVEGDVTLHLMQAEREYMRSHVEDVTQRNRELVAGMERMRRMLAEARGVDPASIDLEAILAAGDDDDDDNGSMQPVAPRPLMRTGYDHVLAEKVLHLEEKVGLAIEALQRKEERITNQAETLRTITSLEDRMRLRLEEVTSENDNLARELARVEERNEMLQGHMIDNLSDAQLMQLVRSLTDAVERVRFTVQVKRLRLGTRGGGSAAAGVLSRISPDRTRHSRMSVGEMKRAVEDLRVRNSADSLVRELAVGAAADGAG